MRKAVGVAERGGLHADFSCDFVHEGDECLGPFPKQGASPSSEGQGSVVATGQHECVEELHDGESISLVEFSRSAANFDYFLIDLHDFLIRVDIELDEQPQGGVEGHDFGETGDLCNFLVVVARHYLVGRVLHHDEAIRPDSRQIFLVYVEQLFAFVVWGQFVSLLLLLALLLADVDALLHPQAQIAFATREVLALGALAFGGLREGVAAEVASEDGVGVAAGDVGDVEEGLAGGFLIEGGPAVAVDDGAGDGFGDFWFGLLGGAFPSFFEVAQVHFSVVDEVDLAELFAFEEDVGAFVAGADAVAAALGVLDAEEFALLGEGLGAEQVRDALGGEGHRRHVLAPHHQRGVFQLTRTLHHQYYYQHTIHTLSHPSSFIQGGLTLGLFIFMQEVGRACKGMDNFQVESTNLMSCLNWLK